MPPLIGAVVFSGLATLAELQTIYSLEDAYLLLETDIVDRYNSRPVD